MWVLISTKNGWNISFVYDSYIVEVPAQLVLI